MFTGKPGTKVYIYTDILATILADIQDMANGAIAGSYVTVDSSSQLPLFQGPNTNVDTLYAKPEGGAAVQVIYARVDDRLDSLEGDHQSGVGSPIGAFAGTAGQFYFRKDTPAVAGQRIYICTVTGANAAATTWVATAV